MTSLLFSLLIFIFIDLYFFNLSAIKSLLCAPTSNWCFILFSEKLERIQPTLGGRKLEDIKRRLGVMRQQWNDGQLSEMTRKRMYLLAQSGFFHKLRINVSSKLNLTFCFNF